MAPTDPGRHRLAEVTAVVPAGTSVDRDPARAAVLRAFLLEVVGSGADTPPPYPEKDREFPC